MLVYLLGHKHGGPPVNCEEDLGAVKVGPVSVDDSKESPAPPPKPDPILAPTPSEEPEGDQPFKQVSRLDG